MAVIGTTVFAMQTTHVDLRHAICALSEALDLVGIDDVAHGKRVGIMAAACGKQAGYGAQECDFLFDLGMLHDIGVSSSHVRSRLENEFDWPGVQAHCEKGEHLLHDFPPLAELAPAIRYHHTRWDVLRTLSVPDAVARRANLILLCDRADALAAPYHASNTVLQHINEIRAEVARHAGTYFAPEFVTHFLACSQTEAFWLQLESRAIQAYLADMREHGLHYHASHAELHQLARIFARIVDTKSPYTAAHSQGVASISRLLAEHMGIAPERCIKIEIAGLLHDLGKLRVPDEILDKPGSLTPNERLVIQTHSFETWQILRHIRGFEDIARWAACHHEEPDGTGYPFHLKASEIPLEARILRVADIMEAMAQDRPYRTGLKADEVARFLIQLSQEGRIDKDVAHAALGIMDAAMSAVRS